MKFLHEVDYNKKYESEELLLTRDYIFWVLRNKITNEVIDMDQYRHDLAERHNLHLNNMLLSNKND